jgi:hypothetical protein
MIYRLTIYEANDTTPWVTVTTDPDGTNPWLKMPDSWAQSEVDFTSGSGTIGEIVLQVIDPQDPESTDQKDRLFTERLADSSGRSALTGHRALVEDSPNGSSFSTIFDGVVTQIELMETLVTYSISIRDIRERERKLRLFGATDSCTVLPQGVLDGYGKPYLNAPESDWLVPPTKPLKGVFRLTPGLFAGSYIEPAPKYFLGQTKDGLLKVREEIVLSDAAARVSQGARNSRTIKVLWRPDGSAGAYTEINTAQGDEFILDVPAWLGSSPGREVSAASRIVFPFSFDLTPVAFPDYEDEIEFIVQYIGETSADFPYHIEGLTAGELIKKIYDGDYSDDPPRIRYDESSILALNTPVRIRVTKPIDDAREWIEKNLYVAAGAAPAIIDGVVHAVRYELPPATVEVAELGNAEVDVAPGWVQLGTDAVNVVDVTYSRDQSIGQSDTGYSNAPGDRIISREIVVERRVPEAIALFGEKRRSFTLDALRAVGGEQGQAFSGDVADEVGAQVAARIGQMMTDRFAVGGQVLYARADRTEAAVDALQVGDWAIISTTWTPDYQARKRGGNRLGQIISRRDISTTRVEFTLIDAGPDAQPLNQPTIGTLSQSASQRVVIPIATVPTGAVARVDYAISSSQPSASSGLWTFAGRGAASTSVATPTLPSGRTVWIRARSEAVGRRPSSYTNPVSIAIDTIPRVRKVWGYITDDGIEINWIANEATAGVRIDYVEHPFADDPDYDEGESVDDGASPKLLTDDFDRATDGALSFRVQPYPSFSGGSVSGTPGTPLEGQVVWGLFTGSAAYLVPVTEEERRNGEDVGFFEVRLEDPDATAIRIRSKIKETSSSGSVSGVSDWTIESTEPEDQDLFSRTVQLLPKHSSQVIFEVESNLGGRRITSELASAVFDLGQIPDIVVKAHIVDGGQVYAEISGDFDTASIKAVAYREGEEPGDIPAAVRAATALNGREVTTGNLLDQPLAKGERATVFAFGYSLVNGGGYESTELAQDTVERSLLVPAFLVPITIEERRDEDSEVGFFEVRVEDPDGVATRVRSRIKETSSSGDITGPSDWTIESSSPADQDEFDRSVELVPNHGSQVIFEIQSSLGGELVTSELASPIFDLGFIPDLVISIVIEADGGASVQWSGDFDTRSVKIIAWLEGDEPSDIAADVRAATPINGRTGQTATLVTALSDGDKVYAAAFGYAEEDGDGYEGGLEQAVAVFRTGGGTAEVNVRLVSAEVAPFGIGSVDLDDRQVLLTVELAASVKSVKTIWAEADFVAVPIAGDYTFNVTSGTRQVISYYLGSNPAQTVDPEQFPEDYSVDTVVFIQGYSGDAAGGTLLGEALYRFGPSTNLPVLRVASSTSDIIGTKLLIGSGLTLAESGGNPQLSSSATGTVTSVSGTGTVAGLTLSGTVTTTGNLTLGGTPSIALGSEVTGTLPVTNGGTGATSFTGYLKGNGTSAVTAVAAVPAGDLSGTVAVSQGGTGATNATTARSNLGAGTVNSVGGTGTVAGITLSGTVTNTGNLSLSGTPSINLASHVTGTLPVGNGGSGAVTLTGYLKGNGTSAFTASSTVPVADISGTLPVNKGGTGATTLTGYLKGNGTSAFSTVGTIPIGDISGTDSRPIADVTVSGVAPTGTPPREGALWFVV